MKRLLPFAMVAAFFVVPAIVHAETCSDVSGQCYQASCQSLGKEDASTNIIGLCPFNQPYCCKERPANPVDYTGNVQASASCDAEARAYYPVGTLEYTTCIVDPATDCTNKPGGRIVQGTFSECSTGVCCAFVKSGTTLSCAQAAGEQFIRERGGGAVSKSECADTCQEKWTEIAEKTSDCGAKKCCALQVGIGSPTTLTNPLGQGVTFFTIIQRIIHAFLGFVGALALLVFIYAGITWMTAGSSDRIQKAKDSMKYAVIGLALIVFAYAITTFFLKTLAGG